jgi:serine/threonine-protein kinase
VVHIIDSGVEGLLPYIVMELLEGETLRERLRRPPSVDVVDLAEVVVYSLNGLSAIHDAGILHRDLRPENIFLVNDPDRVYPKILDFGTSRALDPAGMSGSTTREGFAPGSPEYMSPERARGVSDIDQRTDIYSMGAILYEAFVGAPPFSSENPGDLLLKIVKGDAPEVGDVRPEVGAAISDVIARAMATDADERFPTAREMRNALADAVLDYAGPASIPPSVPPPDPPPEEEEIDLPSVPEAPALPGLRHPKFAGKPELAVVPVVTLIEDDSAQQRRKGFWLGLVVALLAIALVAALILGPVVADLVAGGEQPQMPRSVPRAVTAAPTEERSRPQEPAPTTLTEEERARAAAKRKRARKWRRAKMAPATQPSEDPPVTIRDLDY